MSETIKWNSLKEGFEGFEKLALAFVKDRYSAYNWKRTPKTRDGNKDAIALIMGYQPYPDKIEQWWMEAKYSNETTKISRYRLDATIVSAILEGNVTKVIFVTNILVATKTILDIRKALQNSICCESVEFYSKYSLEYWLINNPQYYYSFFNTSNKKNNLHFSLPQLLITQNVDFYPKNVEHITFKEPLRHLRLNDIYVAYFSVYSSAESIIEIKIPHYFRGVSIVSDPKLKVFQGENQLKFYLRISDDYCNIKDRQAILQFKINDLDLLPSRLIIPSGNSDGKFDIISQRKILKELSYNYQRFLKTNRNCILSLEGISGVGKSYILNKFIGDTIVSEDIYFCEFNESNKENYRHLIRAITYLIFPYISPDSLDIEYIKEIKNSDIKNLLLEILSVENDYEKLSLVLDSLTTDEFILPSKIFINRRILIFDNLQYLNRTAMGVLINLLLCIDKNRFPVFTILSAQSYFYENPIYKYFQEKCVTDHYLLSLEWNDVLSCLLHGRIKKLKIENFIFSSLDITVIEVFVFARYIVEENCELSDINEFIFTFRSFQRSGILQKYILDKFKQTFYIYPNCRELCDKIYWSCNPILYEESYETIGGLSHLISSGLVRFNNDDCIIPQHDIYKVVYRMHFRPESFEKLGYPINSAEYMQNIIENSFRPTLLKDTAKKILLLLENRQFYTVLYILQHTFESSEKEKLKNKVSEEIYYNLFLAYGLAAHQQSTYIACEEIFEKLYTETKNSNNIEIVKVAIGSAWEICLISYENLNYEKAQAIGKDILQLAGKVKKNTNLDSCGQAARSSHDIATIDLLMQSDICKETLWDLYVSRGQEMLKNGFYYRFESFRARYALTLCVKDIGLCVKLLDEGRKSIETRFGVQDKHYLWCEFYYNFYMLIWKKDSSYLDKALYFHEKMKKNQIGNYRKKLFAIAAYYYSINDKINGEKYLFMDTLFAQELRSRYKAFYYESLALHEIMNNHSQQALDYLKEAIGIFEAMPEYTKLLNHNIRLINTKNYNPYNICFWLGDSMKSDIYYIDPRSVW